jgi:hypothetical protein
MTQSRIRYDQRLGNDLQPRPGALILPQLNAIVFLRSVKPLSYLVGK